MTGEIMSDKIKTKNAVIERASLTCAERDLLTAYLTLDYGGMGQCFGGYSLYLPKSFSHYAPEGPNYAGHFIARVMQIAGVEEWDKLLGKTIRVRCEWTKVHAIGHIVKDDWFDPQRDFDLMREGKKP